MDSENSIAFYIDFGSDVEGDCEVKGFEKKTQLISWSIDGTQSSSIGHNPGAGVGKFVASELRFSAVVGKETPQFWRNISTGKHSQKVTVSGCMAGGKQIKFYEMVFNETFLTSIQISGDGYNLPVVSGTLAWRSMTMNHFGQNATGGPGGVVSAQWNRATLEARA
jgi:type VI secretion system secreted protein Hcp